MRLADPDWSTAGLALGQRCRRGFSLVEILVVLLILAILSTVALYSYASYRQSLTVESSAYLVQRVLVQARGRAIHLNAPHQAVIDLDANTVWVDQLNATFTERTPKVVPETAMSEFVLIDELQVGSDTFTSGIHTITFETDGGHPLVIMNLRREMDDATDDLNYYGLRLFPNSAEVQILAKTRL